MRPCRLDMDRNAFVLEHGVVLDYVPANAERLALNRPSHLWWQAGIMLDDDPTFRHRQVTVASSSLHVVEKGGPEADPFLFLHGWPESWHSWRQIMTAASGQVRAIAIDLPGVGESTGDPTDGSKRQLAAVVHGLVETIGLKNLTLVGQDVGGMVTYAYLRTFPDLMQSVIMDVVIPGRRPVDEGARQPLSLAFRLPFDPELPERLVQGHQAEYFNYFYDAISADPSKITAEARAGMRGLTPPTVP